MLDKHFINKVTWEEAKKLRKAYWVTPTQLQKYYSQQNNEQNIIITLSFENNEKNVVSKICRYSSERPECASEGGLWYTISFVSNGTSTLITLAIHQVAHSIQSSDDDLQDPATPATTAPLRICH